MKGPEFSFPSLRLRHEDTFRVAPFFVLCGTRLLLFPIGPRTFFLISPSVILTQIRFFKRSVHPAPHLP